MKKALILILSVGLAAALAACSPAATAPAATEGAPAAAPNGTPGPGGFAQSPTMQLLIGTFALENTDNVVTAEQAGKLLPLWQGLQALGTSDATAPEELTAVETQLRATYTSGQLTAIEAITPEDLQQVMADQGLDFGGGAFPDGTPPAGGDGSGFPGGGGGPPPDGGFPDGGGPGGGGPGGDGGFDPSDLSPEQQATFEARAANGGLGGRGGGVPAPLLQAVIEFLTTRAQS